MGTIRGSQQGLSTSPKWVCVPRTLQRAQPQAPHPYCKGSQELKRALEMGRELTGGGTAGRAKGSRAFP